MQNAPDMQSMPPATEERLNTPQSYGRMAWAAARVEFQRNQSQLIGGHSFPRAKKGTRQTIVPTKAYSKEETKHILGACKAQGTTIAHAFFALANIAHMKVTAQAGESDPWAAGKKKDLPTMLYSALNLRPHLSKGPGEAEGISQDFFHLAIGMLSVSAVLRDGPHAHCPYSRSQATTTSCFHHFSQRSLAWLKHSGCEQKRRKSKLSRQRSRHGCFSAVSSCTLSVSVAPSASRSKMRLDGRPKWRLQRQKATRGSALVLVHHLKLLKLPMGRPLKRSRSRSQHQLCRSPALHC